MTSQTVKQLAFLLSFLIGLASVWFGLINSRTVTEEPGRSNALAEPVETVDSRNDPFEPEFFNVTIPEASINELNAADH